MFLFGFCHAKPPLRGTVVIFRSLLVVYMSKLGVIELRRADQAVVSLKGEFFPRKNSHLIFILPAFPLFNPHDFPAGIMKEAMDKFFTVGEVVNVNFGGGFT